MTHTGIQHCNLLGEAGKENNVLLPEQEQVKKLCVKSERW